MTESDQNGCFWVNPPGDTLSLFANYFSGKTSPSLAYEFTCAYWHLGVRDVPLNAQENANFDCLVENKYQVDTHHIFISLVRDALTSKRASLACSKYLYRALSPLK
ncbi:MAG: flavin reductase family protein [Paracoccaceae bacterium]|nr:flavin reductase family protein [Paracoccaceae bacterium]